MSSYLVDLKFREESVEAVDLLSFLDKCVVLGDALQGELVHQVDLVRLLQVLPHEGLHSQGEGSAVEQNLATLGQEADDLVQHPLEVLAEQLVRLIEDEHLAVTHVGHLLLHQVQDPAGSGDHQVNLLIDPHDVVLQIGATCKRELYICKSGKISKTDYNPGHQIRSKI